MMPIHPFAANHAFEAQIISEISSALDAVCRALDLRVVNDPATRLVAANIIELAERGVRGDALRTMTLEKFEQE
jgi:hypothetical protein